jgi:hypothetical protein
MKKPNFFRLILMIPYRTPTSTENSLPTEKHNAIPGNDARRDCCTIAQRYRAEPAGVLVVLILRSRWNSQLVQMVIYRHSHENYIFGTGSRNTFNVIADLCSSSEDLGSREPSSRQQCRLYICHDRSVENDVLPSGIQSASMTGMDTHSQEL